MNIQEETRELEKQGVFIHYSHEHYTNGSNCNFSIEFTRHPYPHRPEDHYQTGWYGDNHEFGDTADVLEASIKMAKWLLRGNNLEWFFYNPNETVSEEGHKKWKIMQKKKDEFHDMLVAEFPTYAAFSKSIDDHLAKSSSDEES